jgi:hypothetical protein
MGDTDTKKEKKAPVPAPPVAEKIVWIACRAKQGCEGKQAKVVMQNKTPGGGSATRYRCLTCGGSFHIST